MSYAECRHELSINLNYRESLRILNGYLSSWNITQNTTVGTLNWKLLTDVMMLLKKIEKKFLQRKYFQNSPRPIKLTNKDRLL